MTKRKKPITYRPLPRNKLGIKITNEEMLQNYLYPDIIIDLETCRTYLNAVEKHNAIKERLYKEKKYMVNKRNMIVNPLPTIYNYKSNKPKNQSRFKITLEKIQQFIINVNNLEKNPQEVCRQDLKFWAEKFDTWIRRELINTDKESEKE